jgi:hypothetical protein
VSAAIILVLCSIVFLRMMEPNLTGSFPGRHIEFQRIEKCRVNASSIDTTEIPAASFFVDQGYRWFAHSTLNMFGSPLKQQSTKEFEEEMHHCFQIPAVTHYSGSF